MTAVLFVATVLIWGSTWIAIAMQLGPVPVLVSILYRFALSALVLLPALIVFRRLAPVRPRDHLFMALQGLCLFSLNFLCFYNATRFVPSGLVSVVFSLATIANAVNARIFFGERIAGRMVLATLVGAAGLAVLFGPAIAKGGLGAGAPWGVALAVVGTCLFSFGNMVSRRNSAAGVPPATANAYGMTYASALLLAVVLATGTPIVAPPDLKYGAALVYLAVIGSVVGFTAYLTLVARIGSGRAAYATVMFPVVALVLSALFEGYVWDWTTVAGLILTVAGNVVAFGGPRIPALGRPSPAAAGR
jgi:drug/metabolite transporter (DMT)-like permease